MDIHKLHNPELAWLTGRKAFSADISRSSRNGFLAGKRPSVSGEQSGWVSTSS
ncbi:MAG: hypothetical protein NTV01_09675 [Bacteroidia bacterium]|nr:hypothetical protein [Bacteroidia bacterium]